MALSNRELVILKTFARADSFIEHHGEQTVKEIIANREDRLKGSMTEEQFMEWCANNPAPQQQSEETPPVGYLTWEDYSADQYKRDRLGSYPSIGDQLDMIFKSGVLDGTDWAAAIQAVKDAHPKPE